MTRPILTLAALLLLPGCATLTDSLQRFEAVLDAGSVIAWDAVQRDFCPAIPRAAPAATTIACVARANGTTREIVAQTIAGAQQACATGQPPVTSVRTLARRVVAAIAASQAAEAAGCGVS